MKIKINKFWKKKSKIEKWQIQVKKESILNYNIPILKEVKKYVEDNGGNILLVDNPQFPTSNLTNNENQIRLTKWNKGRTKKLRNNPGFLGNGYFTTINANYTHQIFSGPPNKMRKSYWINDDFENSYVSVKHGYRQGLKKKYTEYRNTVYLFGSSVAYSFGCEESHTVSSFLETQINNPDITVVNRGIRGGNLANSVLAILDTKISHGDLVILYSFKPISTDAKIELLKNFNYLDLVNIFTRPHNYGDVFFDSLSHLTPAGNKIVANLIAKKIQHILCNKKSKIEFASSDNEKNIFNKFILNRHRAALLYIDKTFPAYIEFLKSEYQPGNNGFAAMNCNPFTLGHKHLISKASETVDNLYVFVLEEDKSAFPFKQRFEMVKEGVKDIKNVIVVPTGKFVISSMTFPDYFSKEDGFNPSMNVAYDLEIFVNYISPVLKIRSRFIGTEPFCKTTRTQHDIMKKTLPQEGISVVEIDRKENEFGPISAAKVRKLIKTKDFNKLDLFLPKTTINLLLKYGTRINTDVS
jgi:[citrate (pro-3S)-lyase] ligase